MSGRLRLLFFCACSGLMPAPAPAAPPPQPAAPAAAPDILPPVPAVIDVVTFEVRDEGENRKLVVTLAPGRLRVDTPDDGLSIIYRPDTQFYTGLENRNYTYWEFSWPDVKAAVESTKRYETRLKDLGADNGYLPDNGASPMPGTGQDTNFSASASFLDTNSAGTPPPQVEGNVSGYVWKPTAEKKRISGLECVHWTGESDSGEPVDAWCYAGPLPKVQEALAQLRAINEPIALVPVRTLMPPFVFEVEDDLSKGGVTPVLITWGDARDQSRFELAGIKARHGDARLFSVPSLYVKTTLVTMDGIGAQKPPGMVKPQEPETTERPERPIP